jgi:hypothetical protein
MSTNFLYLCGLFAGISPFLAIAVILLLYLLRRTAWKIRQGRGDKHLGFCPSASALGMALLFMQVFVRPSLQTVLEQKQEEDVVEDDQGGDPESRENHLNRQLKRIRRGERVDGLILRL